MDLIERIRLAITGGMQEIFSHTCNPGEIQINETKPEFEGDYAVVLFGFVKKLKKKPEDLGQALGDHLLKKEPELIAAFSVVSGFLNLTVSDTFLTGFLRSASADNSYGKWPRNGKRVMVEYSSPNTNKPLHLGHLRNNFLGWSVAAISQAAGYDIVKTCIANDRGIHICKSMIAWQRYANGATPESTGIKGDHFVGNYYVLFGEKLKPQTDALIAAGQTKEEAEQQAPLMQEARQMLVEWEMGKPAVMALWKQMNNWVYAGFDVTYKRIGSDFDKIYYESETYLLGKELVDLGLQKKVFFQKEDGSVWIDLTADGLDEKIVRRRDGTAVYITQDIGLAVKKNEDFPSDQSIYVVADEQNYHFRVLKLICQKLKLPGADEIHHLNYGLVELPTGRMKTREGTVVDADDLLDEMVRIAAGHTSELGKVEDFTDAERQTLYETIGVGALKFFLLRVDPKRKMIFAPDESIDFHGFTGPFVQYAYARIRSILRKETAVAEAGTGPVTSLLPLEKSLLVAAERFPSVIKAAAEAMDPSQVAGYAFSLAKTFNSFYAEHSISRAETDEKKRLRTDIVVIVSGILKTAMDLLGIAVPERM